MTAAHCLAHKFDNITIILGKGFILGNGNITYTSGMVDIEDEDGSDERLVVKAKQNVRMSHFMFENRINKGHSKMVYDIALLELEDPVIWDNHPNIR